MTTEPDPAAFLLRSRRVVLPGGECDGAVEIRDGRIAAVHRAGRIPPGLPVEDLGHLALLPGLIDAHVHINEPGRTEWEGFESATRAALAGGITTLFDMPLNSSPVCTTAGALRLKKDAAHGRLWADVGFFGGLVRGNAGRMRELLDEGVFGIKTFLCDSGLEEFPPATEEDLREAMPVLAAAGVPLLVHAELVSGTLYTPSNPRRYAEWLASRPAAFELRAIELVLRLARETGCEVHIVHLSTADALPLLADARRNGIKVAVETCPHYLIFDAESIPDGDTRFKCAPPIRDAANRERLWQGLRDGIITRIASDHSPCPPEMKARDSGDFFRAWGGISSLQLGLPAVWTEARRRGFTLADVAGWMAAGPMTLAAPYGARQASAMRGFVMPGMRADLVAFDPEAPAVTVSSELYHRHGITPYEGFPLTGRIVHVWKRGLRVYRDRRFVTGPQGRVFHAWRAGAPVPEDAEDAADLLPPAGYVKPLPADGLMRLNALPEPAARELFFRCCGSGPWTGFMARLRPFADSSALYAAARYGFESLFHSRQDWLEPFSHHPRIGDLDSLRAKFATTRDWASQEQAGTAAASEETLRALAEGNAEYERKFGYIFIVCATGKSADEMLTLLRERLTHDPDEEWRIAAEEQKKITWLRLGKLEIPE